MTAVHERSAMRRSFSLGFGLALVMSALMVLGCGDDDGTTSGTAMDGGDFCQAGAVGCICRPGFGGGTGTCDDEGVECVDGMCVAPE